MKISRRDFLKLCGLSAAALGLSATDMGRLKEALANPDGPKVIWLQGSACTGCSVSLLNRISAYESPADVADLLINTIDLVYHPNLMALAGESAVDQIQNTYDAGGYVLAVEGGVPTKFGGSACWAWNTDGKDVTFQKAVSVLAAKAAAVLCIGTCSSYGGMPAAPPNPAGVKSVREATGKSTINIPGCPTNPDWIISAVALLLAGSPIDLDSFGRPKALFGSTVHDLCWRQNYYSTNRAQSFGIDNLCLRDLGCRGPETYARCPSSMWNNFANWCVDANAPCLGCTEPSYPGGNFYRMVRTADGDDHRDDSERRDD